MKFLTESELASLNYKNLYWHLKKVRSIISYMSNYYGPRCCEECLEYIGDDWENDVGKHVRPYKEYFKKVKKELNSRPYQQMSKTSIKKAAMLRRKEGSKQKYTHQRKQFV